MAKPKRNKDRNSSKLFVTGIVVFSLGLFFSYGIVIFAGIVLMISGRLPPAGDENDSIQD